MNHTPEIGERFGELVVERESEEHPHAHAGREWLCRCDCGRAAIRTTSQLNLSRKEGRSPCCHECRIELWLGTRVAVKRSHIERLLARYQETGVLYSVAD